VRAETAIEHPTIVQPHCRGTVLHARVASPALHGVVGRLAKDGRTLRYTPSHAWFSPDGERTPDRFLIDVENRDGVVSPSSVSSGMTPLAHSERMCQNLSPSH
jgi:hypothetical protein